MTTSKLRTTICGTPHWPKKNWEMANHCLGFKPNLINFGQMTFLSIAMASKLNKNYRNYLKRFRFESIKRNATAFTILAVLLHKKTHGIRPEESAKRKTEQIANGFY